MKRWKTLAWGAALTAGVSGGCKQQLFQEPADAQSLASQALPKGLEIDPSFSTLVPHGDQTPVPPTIKDPDRPARPITLAEAFAIALEQGNRGVALINGLTLGNAGTARLINDDLTVFTGGGVTGDDAIRTFTLDPAIYAANIEASLAKFDVRLLSTITWSRRDDAVANVLGNFQNGDQANVSSSLFKPLATGGLAGITTNVDYAKLGAPPAGSAVINPSYRPSLTFSIEQPLFQSYGVEINQLLNQHPGSFVNNGFQPTGGSRVEGILITRLRYDQGKLQFERDVNVMVLNVENAYWNLYAAYGLRYASEQGVRQSYQVWDIQRLRFQAGKANKQDEAEARAQLWRFRQDYATATQNVLEAERQLHRILGLPSSDGQQLLPVDAPTLAEYVPEWSSSVDEMMLNRPELLIAMTDVKFRQFDLIVQRNGLRPDFRVGANYNINGIGDRLDGSGPNLDTSATGSGNLPGNALASLADNRNNSYNIFLRLSVPLGFREAHANVRVAQLNLARSYISLQNQRDKGRATLHQAFQELFYLYESIKLSREQREALEQQLIGIAQRIQAGDQIPTTINLLNAQIQFTTALSREYQAIAAYNSKIAAIQFQKGTILNFNSIVIADGALPQVAVQRAADHERQRSAGILARQRADGVAGAASHAVTQPREMVEMPAMLERETQMRKNAGMPGTIPDTLKSVPRPGEVLPSPSSGPPATLPPIGAAREPYKPVVVPAAGKEASPGVRLVPVPSGDKPKDGSVTVEPLPPSRPAAPPRPSLVIPPID